MSTAALLEVYEMPITGSLYVVGDLHGCYDLLMYTLAENQFDFEHDMLISVGDLVDRGVQNRQCADLILQPWFKAVRGNHEQLCIKGLTDPEMQDIHRRAGSGGEWFYHLSAQEQQRLIGLFQQLPLVLEVNYGHKKYGFVHADISFADWDSFKQAIMDDEPDAITAHRTARSVSLWGAWASPLQRQSGGLSVCVRRRSDLFGAYGSAIA
jgi:serine/threonine protein phosphatase 1